MLLLRHHRLVLGGHDGARLGDAVHQLACSQSPAKTKQNITTRKNGEHGKLQGRTVFLFESVEFDLVGLVLGLLFEAAGARGQLVLLLARFGPHGDGKLGDGRHVVDEPVQFVQLAADAVQLARVRRQVVAVAAPRLAAAQAFRSFIHSSAVHVPHVLSGKRSQV